MKLQTVILATGCLLMYPPAHLHAQSTFGSIIGTVQDSSGAQMPGVAIKIRNVNDNSSRATTTDNAGEYQVLNLRPGTYEILASKESFHNATVPNITLESRQQLRADLKLELAEVTQEVNVEAAAGSVNTENGVIGDTKNFNQVVQLPMNYRGGADSPLTALVAVPGVQQDSGGNLSIGGGTPAQIQYSVDGTSTVNIRQNGALGNMNPSSELISEMKVTEFNNNAEFSQLADVTIITKSGANTFHGSAFEYLQNSALDATTWGFDSKAQKAFNTFGGSFSGPVEIPHLYKRKDKTFFFADYEGNRRRFTTPEVLSVPTAAVRAGDLTNLPGGSAVDPTTGAPFPGNQIPKPQLNSVGQSLLNNYIPLPNFGNGVDTSGNYRVQAPTPANINGYDIRIDHNISDKQQIYGRWSWKNVDTSGVNGLLPTEQHVETNRNLVLSHNYAIRPNILNEIRFGSTFQSLTVDFPLSGAAAVQTLGLSGLNLGDVPGVNAFPTFNFSDSTGFTAIGRDKTGVTRSQTIQVTDNLSWVKGQHTVKFGVDFRRVRYTDLESFGGSDDFGDFTFNAGTFTGNAFADLLLGLPSKSYIAQSGPDTRLHAYQTGAYAQDEWHATKNLTVTMGLRWQALPPFVSENNNLGAFDPSTGGFILPNNGVARQGMLESINACPGVNPALPCAPIETAGKLGLGNGLREFYKLNFQPRVGLAYRPFGDNKTVFRAGFGIFTMSSLGQLSFNTTNINVGIVQTTANQLPSGQASFTFPAVGAPVIPALLAGTGDFYQNVDLHYRDPQSAQWNVTVERQLISDLSLRVSYVGMNSYRMGQTVDLNQQAPSVTPNDYSLRPYPNWGRILSSENQGFSNYQALESQINKRFGHGLMFQADHTWAHNIGNVGGDAPSVFSPEVIYGTPVADRFDLAANRGDIVGTRQHRVLVSAIYQLPVGKGRAYLKNMNAVSEAVLGGWELSTVSLWQTGPHLTAVTSPAFDTANLNLVFTGALLRPDCTGNPVPSTQNVNEFFNIAGFNPVPAPGRIGNCGVGTLTGPGTATIAGGLSKTFQVREKARLRFEATFTNLLNHTNYAPPAVDVSSPATFGKITTAQSAENSGNRTGQLALRLDF
ncbi:MAG TPA: carboxypeptidase regulatory-like domain-containing protein [Bryobacteraceae bacterium]|nr:carboxypeptidase regulatory-like domain-containing protein [Bryobacteraceae bacterium]